MKTRMLFLAATVLATLSANNDEQIRCDGKLLGAGRSRLEVLRYCGEPQDKVAFLDERVIHRRFSNVLVGSFRETRQTGTYVDTSRSAVSTETNPRDKEPVLAGQQPQQVPAHQHDERRIVTDTTVVSQSSYTLLSSYWECQKQSVFVDEYTYNFGSGKFMTFVRFENGRVKSIKFGEYGF
ncbi:DUF2845 domain-containing protein [Turneriella parva]|uniref:DUF2845 domain-containing protein n=1 Tax=Turneriella parva (strain ATCC BAA-1111 / DSM 21527 / NCTC 11395 / H) TaxID=869212 RepID=I4B0X8_TURPD|nr:DUF2845 domain-containing protein [Turneriella parva]AFM10935.1 hypothetical protein Turpa_0275 [Turneriella parva DSM 21527]